ncbi:MAG: tetratricopeptide repeat protein [Bacteroidetes bacterium]|nr:tetratricopeptide repeat protein [Bacteroidota bacterium]
MMPLGAQQTKIDSLRRVLRETAECDTNHIRALGSLCDIYRGHNTERSYHYAKQRLEIATRCGLKKWMASSHMRMAAYFIDRGEIDSCLLHCRSAMAISKEIGNDGTLADAHTYMGWAHGIRGARNDALKHLNAALELYERMGDKQGTAQTLSNIGIQYHDQGMLDRAAEHFARALRIAEELDDRHAIAKYLLNLGNTQKNDAKALQYYSRALELQRELGHKRGYAHALMLIANIHKKDNHIASKAYLQEALPLAEELQDPQLISYALLNLGDLERLYCSADSAMMFYRRALEIAGRTQDIRTVCMAHTGIARLFRCTPLLQADAMYHAEEALRLARMINDRQSALESLMLLSWVHEVNNDLARALSAHQAAYALKDSIDNETNTKHINELTARYEADKRENELRLLERDKALKESEISRIEAESRRQSAELARRALESLQQSQRLSLLASERELDRLDAEKAKSEATLQRETARRQAREADLLARENQLQASILEREKLLRNSILGGLLLLAIASFLGLKRLRGLKREASLKAEAAEYKAGAAEAKSLALAAETERRDKHAQQEFSRRLIELQEEERKRISSELHDSLSQELIVIKNRAILAIKADGDAETAKTHMDEVVSLAVTALTDVRQISRTLRPYQIDLVGLSETLRGALRNVSQSALPQLSFEIGDIDGLLPRENEVTLFRLMQESVNNIVRHAQATEAKVIAVREDEYIRLTVTDNGRGFDPSAPPVPGKSGGLGLLSMKERVSMLNGILALDSAPGRGTRVDIRVPVR